MFIHRVCIYMYTLCGLSLHTHTQKHTHIHTHRLWPNVGSLVVNLRDVLPNRKDQVSVKVLTNSTHQAIPDAHIIIQVACVFCCEKEIGLY
jgi:hypothetical protein